jgi:hypothetical protein
MTLNGMLKHFLITIDTEGDNLWSRPKEITCRNARFLPRFQDLCEKHGFKPTYLTNFEMATDPFFREFGKEVVRTGAAEIGMHLHAWNSPPLEPLTADDYGFQPYLTEYNHDVMRRKIEHLTKLLADTFDSRMNSHRGGRWAFDEVYASMLVAQGYTVDCSVTPYLSWKAHTGDPAQKGGPDYTDFPDHAYFVDLDDVSRPGASPLLEIPLTVLPGRSRVLQGLVRDMKPSNMIKRAVNLLFPAFSMLSLRRGRLSDLKKTAARCVREDRPYVEFMTHSSQLMPGGSPAFSSARDIERIYEYLEELFEYAGKHFKGATLTEFGDLFARNLDPGGNPRRTE